ncbi:MAG: glucokinase [Betaproteobacteria bacterium]|nr:glucokinase [Betaproteobacteria bacterium]
MIIAGDIGATKTLLQLVEFGGGRRRLAFERRYADAEYSDFHSLMSAFLDQARASGVDASPLEIAVLGIAAPVGGERVRLTNRDWVIDAEALSHAFGIKQVRLVNDFVAAARGIELLEPRDFVTLQEGEPDEKAPRVVLGAGSGLGVAYLIRSGERYQVVAGEGGNAGFAPATPLQAQLWLALHERTGHVCIEQVVSGAGLVAIYDFLREQGAAPESPQLSRAFATEDRAAAITAFAMDKGDPLANAALDFFIDAYGATAGDHALALLARGGVFVAGGIAPRIIARIQDGRFIASFRAKGRFAGLMAGIPVRVVMNAGLGVLGATAIAMEMR